MTAGGSSWGWEGPSDRRFTVEFETGAIWQSRNEIHIPDNENGTRFDLRSLQGTSPDVHRRAELTWNVPPRHSLRFVYAPIGFSGNGSFATPVRFAGGTFVPGEHGEVKLHIRFIQLDLSLSGSRIRVVAVANRRDGFHSRWQSGIALRRQSSPRQ